MCHPHYKQAKEGEPIGALSYIRFRSTQIRPTSTAGSSTAARHLNAIWCCMARFLENQEAPFSYLENQEAPLS